MTYSLDLLFYDSSKATLPGPSIAQIYVKTHTNDKEGHILITPYCNSITELEYQIDRLKQELETIKKKAIQKYKKENKRNV